MKHKHHTCSNSGAVISRSRRVVLRLSKVRCRAVRRSPISVATISVPVAMFPLSVAISVSAARGIPRRPMMVSRVSSVSLSFSVAISRLATIRISLGGRVTRAVAIVAVYKSERVGKTWWTKSFLSLLLYRAPF